MMVAFEYREGGRAMEGSGIRGGGGVEGGCLGRACHRAANKCKQTITKKRNASIVCPIVF